MAEEKLGTLQYEMLVDQKKLEQQLDDITKKLQEKDKQWKEILSGQGTTVSPKINVADLGNLTKANEAIATSTLNIETSIKKLKKELATNIKDYEKLTQVKRENSAEGQKLLVDINRQKDKLSEYNKTLRQSIEARKLAAVQAKEELSAKQSLESQRSKAFVKSNLDEEKQLTAEIKKQESALRALEAQRSKAFVSGNIQKEKQLTAEIKAQESAMRSLEAQRSKAYVSNQNKALREEQQLLKAAWQEQKLKLAVDNQAAGSIERLRAQYALLKFQLSQVKFSDPGAIANINKLQTAISGVKSEIQALQPTIGTWGKLRSAIQTYATAYLSVQGVMGLGKAIYNQTKELDALDFSMKTVIKSSVELSQTQKFLSDVAVNYGGDLLTLSERYIKFRAAAVQSNVSAAETQKIFESVSKAAGTLGLKTDELSGVYLALEQMLSKGKVTTEELRRQLGERLPGAFGIMANALGVTIPELDKMLKKGEVLSTVALPKFAAALEKAYGIENLKKIDTLAAAQGRLSTEFTGLIKSMEASDEFKQAINYLASFIGFIKDNIGVIGLFAKAMVALGVAYTANKVRLIALNAARFIAVVAMGLETKAVNAMSAAQLKSAMATYTNIRALTTLKGVVAALGGVWSIIINGLALAAIAIYSFAGKTKQVSEEMKTFIKESNDAKNKVKELYEVLGRTAKNSNLHKEALSQLNQMSIQYNSSLTTENDLLDKNNVKRQELLGNIEKELKKKYFLSEMDAAEKAKTDVFDPIRQKFIDKFQYDVDGYNKAILEYNKFLDIAANKTKNTAAFLANSNWGGTFISSMYDATKALNTFAYEQDRIKKQLGSDPEVSVFDPSLIKKAQDEFAAFDTAVKKGYDNIFTSFTFKDEETPTLVAWLNKQIEDMNKGVTKFDERSMVELKDALYDALNPEEKGRGGKSTIDLMADRIEAQKKLAQMELDVRQRLNEAIIAAMKDGASKQYAQLQSDYDKRLTQIKEQEQAYLETLNKSKGLEITDAGYITTLPKDIQSTFDQQRVKEKEKLNEDIFKLDADLVRKQEDIWDSATDTFISDVERQKKSVNKKYDELINQQQALATSDSSIILDELTGNIIVSQEAIAVSQKAIDDLNISRKKELLQIEADAVVKLSEFYQKAFGDIEKYGYSTLVKIKEQLDAVIQSARETEIDGKSVVLVDIPYLNEQGKAVKRIANLTTEEFLKFKDQAIKINDSIEKENPFKALKNSFESMIKAIKKGNKDDIGTAANTFTESFNVAKSMVDDLADSLGKAFGEDVAKDIKAITSAMEGVNTVGEGAINIISGNVLTGTIQVVKGFADIISSLNHFKTASKTMEEFYADLEDRISKLVSKVELLNSTLSKVGSSSSISGLKILQSNLMQLASDASRLNEQLKEIASGDGRRRGTTTQGATTNGTRPNSTEVEAERKRVVVDLIKQTEYLNEQIILLSNKLLNPNLTEEQRKAIESVLQGYIDIVDAIDSSIQNITGTSINELSNAIVDAFLAGENAAEAWGAKVNDIIRYMVKQQLVAQLLTKPITQAIQTLVADSEDTLTPEEALKFKNTIKGITEDVSPTIAAASDAMKLVGIDLSSGTSSSTGLSKGIQALTEDTGRRLEGMLNSIRETGVINMGSLAKVQALVESSQAIQAYSAQSLGHLRNIDMTTAAQLTLFNELVGVAGTSGKSGLRVVIQ